MISKFFKYLESAEKLPYWAMFFAPFLYAVQVLSGISFFSLLFYGILGIVASIKLYCLSVSRGLDCTWREWRPLQKAVFLFVCVIFIGSLNELILLNAFTGYLRIILIYLVPLVFFMAFAGELKALSAAVAIVYAGVIVAAESLYEFFSIMPTPYEQINFDYVKRLSGMELFQLLGGVRPTGLVEHLHATQFILVCSFLCATLLMIHDSGKKRSWLFLFLSLILFSAVISNGARILMLLGFVAWVMIYKLHLPVRGLLRKQLLALAFSVVCLYCVSRENTYFWHVTYFQYPIKIAAFVMPNDFTRNLLARTEFFVQGNDSLSAYFREDYDILKPFETCRSKIFVLCGALLTGFGFGEVTPYVGAASDDRYLFQLMWQLGLIGSILFAFILSYVWRIAWKQLKYGKDIEVMLLLVMLVLLPGTFIHSGVLVRKACWLMFCFSIALASKLEIEQSRSRS